MVRPFLKRGFMIIYQDKEIVVCNKPYGISSQLSTGENMVDILKNQCGCEIYPVHRLDTQTTGLMVYGKTQKSAAELSCQMQEKVFKKEYICLCHGDICGEGEMTDFLFHDRLKNKSFVSKTKRAGTKEAKLAYKVIDTKNAGECRLSKVLVKLYTGRTHQIRVQFASRGYVLYGDGKYGARDNDKIHLHSSYISFVHPRTKENMEFTQSAPWE